MNSSNTGESPQSAHLLKVLLIGDTSVGKTCLIKRFSDEGFTKNFMTTVGIDYKRKVVQHDGKYFKLTIWDTAGQERFRSITIAYFRGCQGMLLVYDVGNRKTFDGIQQWMEQIREHTMHVPDEEKPKIVLVGNKSDLQGSLRLVSTEEGQKLAQEHGVPFIETSAKEDTNVTEAFMTITRIVHESGILNVGAAANTATLKDPASPDGSGGAGCAC